MTNTLPDGGTQYRPTPRRYAQPHAVGRAIPNNMQIVIRGMKSHDPHLTDLIRHLLCVLINGVCGTVGPVQAPYADPSVAGLWRTRDARTAAAERARSSNLRMAQRLAIQNAIRDDRIAENDAAAMVENGRSGSRHRRQGILVVGVDVRTKTRQSCCDRADSFAEQCEAHGSPVTRARKRNHRPYAMKYCDRTRLDMMSQAGKPQPAASSTGPAMSPVQPHRTTRRFAARFP